VSTKEQLVLPFPGGPFPGVPFAPVEEGETGVGGDNHASVRDRCSGGDADGVCASGCGGQAAAKARPIPQNRRELALAIFAQCDPVALGRGVLENGDDRGASVRLRGLEMFTEWAYGKEEAAEPVPTRVIWDLPRRGERRDGAGSPGSEPAGGGER
jgi:hypothetical protein